MIELLVAMGLLMVIISIMLLMINPLQIQARARDTKRIADLLALTGVIEMYRMDYGVLPDEADQTRRSDVFSGSVSQKSNGTGWIPVDLGKYLPNLPVDPFNKTNGGVLYVYRYRRDSVRYKVDVPLEYYKDLMENDGGIDVNHYERGTGMEIGM